MNSMGGWAKFYDSGNQMWFDFHNVFDGIFS